MDTDPSSIARPEGFSLAEFERAVGAAGAHVPAVSGWRVGMHVHHCCLSMIGIGKALARSVPPPPGRFPSAIGSIVLLSGTIPRGRARTPDVAAPDADVTEPELREMLDESARWLAGIAELDRRAWIRHPSLGILTRDRARRFVRIHNRHHSRIVADIVAAAMPRSA